MKKEIIGALIFIFSVFIFNIAQAEEKIKGYLFYGEGCPHCAKEREFFSLIEKDYPSLELKSFEIYHNSKNANLMSLIAEKMQIGMSGVPFLVIGDKHFVGYNEEITALEIKKAIEECLKGSCPDPVADIIENKSETSSIDIVEPKAETLSEPKPQENNQKEINLPLIGTVNPAEISLPVLTILVGVLDGFNPCAMWVLLFLISLLLRVKSKKRRWVLGTAFIVASASVYFVFMSAWLNLILFIGFIFWIRLIIGLLALFGGAYNIKEFLFNKTSGCKASSNEKREKIFKKIRSAIEEKSFLLALGGIILLAFLVNLIELVCSAGLPAVYTQVLALNQMTAWHYYAYILGYIFFFMLDDLFVFFVAMTTLEMTGITTKYSRYARLVGGLIMLTLGILFLFKPEWLSFS